MVSKLVETTLYLTLAKYIRPDDPKIKASQLKKLMILGKICHSI